MDSLYAPHSALITLAKLVDSVVMLYKTKYQNYFDQKLLEISNFYQQELLSAES